MNLGPCVRFFPDGGLGGDYLWSSGGGTKEAAAFRKRLRVRWGESSLTSKLFFLITQIATVDVCGSDGTGDIQWRMLFHLCVHLSAKELFACVKR